MKCTIMQPTYLPWMGYFDLIDQVDKFVFLDDVKLEKQSWQTRNRIKTGHGIVWLTVPVLTPKGRDRTLINETQMKDDNWKKKHLKSIYYAYQKAPYFDEVYGFIEIELGHYGTDGPFWPGMLSDSNFGVIVDILDMLGLSEDKDIIYVSSALGVKGVKDERLLNIVRGVGCDEYVSPVGSAAYLEQGKVPGGRLGEAGIKVCYQNYRHPVYEQLYGGFVSHLSVIDLLMNVGFDSALAVIRSGRGEAIPCEDFRKQMLAC